MKRITMKSLGYPKDRFINHKMFCVPYPSVAYEDVKENMNGNIPDDGLKILSDGSKYIISRVYRKTSDKVYEVEFEYSGFPIMEFESDVILWLIVEYKRND